MRQPTLALAWLAACAPAVLVRPAPPAAHVEPRREIAVGSYWEEVAYDPIANATGPVALEPEKLVRNPLGTRWEGLDDAVRKRALERGVVEVARTDHQASIGAAYTALATSHVPFVITLDALFAVTLRAVDCAEGDLDQDVLLPLLGAALRASIERLTAEARAQRSDTAEAYAIARGVLLVAVSLLDPAFEVPGDVKERVTTELKLVQTHAGYARSGLLGRPLDYGAFDLQAGLAFGDARIGPFRAFAWLARAALALVPEARQTDLATARTDTRAAMLLARAMNEGWSHLREALSFVSGGADDPGPERLLAAAQSLGIDLRDESNVASVVRVDKLRMALARAAAPTLEDTGLRMPTFRVLSPSAPPDAWALHGEGEASGRALPTALAVGVALGSPDARALLEAGGLPPKALDAIAALMPAGADQHTSLHASALEAIAVYLAPSSLDAQRPWRDSASYRRRKLGTALAAWATLRHDDLPFGHGAARAVLDEPLASFDDVPAVVEPHPEAIARLLALVRQARRGLGARGTLRESSGAAQLLDRVETVLQLALDAVASQARGTPARALATVPARLVALERRLGPAASPLVVVTAADPASGSLLEQATGYVDDVWLAVETGDSASLYAGVRIPFYETTATLRSNDASWAKQLSESPPPRPAWAD